MVIDAWIVEYNTDRPHQSLGRCTPAERFATRTADAGPTLDSSALAERRVGDGWISRRVAGNGVISVSWQQFGVAEALSMDRSAEGAEPPVRFTAGRRRA